MDWDLFFIITFFFYVNACHVNEVGAISVIPPARIVLEKLHIKERHGDYIFAGKFETV